MRLLGRLETAGGHRRNELALALAHLCLHACAIYGTGGAVLGRVPTDVGGRWRLAIVLRHRRRPEEASKQYPGEAPYTNRGLRHVGEAPLTNRGSAT